MTKKLIVLLITLVTVISFISPVKARATGNTYDFVPVTDGQTVTLKNAASGYFMNLKHGSPNSCNGANITLYPWDGTNTEKFIIHCNENGSFMLAPACTPNRFVDIRRYGKPITEGQGVVIWSEDGDPIKAIHFKKIGGYIALVFDIRPDICLAPSSPEAARTKQSQLVTRKLDENAIEMLWVLCDADGAPIDTEVDHIPVIIEPLCLEGYVLGINGDGLLVCEPKGSSMNEIAGQILILSKNPVGYGYTLSSITNGKTAWLTFNKYSNNVPAYFSTSLNSKDKTWSKRSFTIKSEDKNIGSLNELHTDSKISFIFGANKALDVTDYGASDDKHLQLYNYTNNSAQIYKITIINNEYLISNVPLLLRVDPRGQRTDQVCSNTAVNTLLDWFDGESRVSDTEKLSDTSCSGIVREINTRQSKATYTYVQIKGDDGPCYNIEETARIIRNSLDKGAPCIVSTLYANRKVFNYIGDKETLPGGHLLVCNGLEKKNGIWYVTLSDPFYMPLYTLPGDKRPKADKESYYTHLPLSDVYDCIRCVIYAK